MKIRARLVITYFAVALVPILIVTYLSYVVVSQLIIKQNSNSLIAIADLKVATIDNYIRKFIEDVGIAQDYYNVKTNLPIVTKFIDSPTSKEYLAAQNMLDGQMQKWFKERNDVIDFLLVAPNGKVVYSANPDHRQKELNTLLSGYEDISFEKGKSGIYISDPFIDSLNKNLYTFLAIAPVVDSSNKFIGEVALEADATVELYKRIQDLTGLGDTGETYSVKLVDAGNGIPASVLFLNPLRFDPQAALVRTALIGDANSIPAQNAALGLNGDGFSVDYRGQKVLAVWRQLGIKNWGLVSKIDRKEVFLPIYTFGFYIILFVIIATCLAAWLVWLFSKSLTDPIIKITNSAKKIAEGDLSVSLPNGNIAKSKNEIGQLAKSLNGMTESLRRYSSNLEEQVKIKTEQLEDQNSFLKDSNRAMINLSEDLEVEKNKAVAKDDEDKAILSSIGEGLVVLDKDDRISFLNSQAEILLKYKLGEVVGSPWDDIVTMLDEKENVIPKEKRPFWAVKNTGMAITTDVNNDKYFYKTLRTAKSFPVALTITPVISKGKNVGIVVVFRDVTKEAEINRAKTEFVSLASHQLRTPVSAIKWYSEMLLGGDTGKLTPKQKKYIGAVYHGNERMVTLINDLLDVSRMEMGKLVPKSKPVDIKKIINEIIKEHKAVTKAKKIKVDVEFAKDVPIINSDPTLIRIALQNIISNAIGYTPSKGKVSCKVQVKFPAILFEIKDSGIGIPKDKQDKIFTKLFRSENAVRFKPEGTGLGLYLTKAMIEILGGRIWFESSDDPKGPSGTTFWFTLPLPAK